MKNSISPIRIIITTGAIDRDIKIHKHALPDQYELVRLLDTAIELFCWRHGMQLLTTEGEKAWYVVPRGDMPYKRLPVSSPMPNGRMFSNPPVETGDETLVEHAPETRISPPTEAKKKKPYKPPRPVIIEGKRYESVREADKALGIPFYNIKSRCAAKVKWQDWYFEDSSPKTTYKDKRGKPAKSCMIEGKRYDSIVKASKAVGMSFFATRHRLLHETKWKDWYFE